MPFIIIHDIKIGFKTKVDDVKVNVVLIMPLFNDTIRTTVFKILANLYIYLNKIMVIYCSTFKTQSLSGDNWVTVRSMYYIL